MSSHCTLLSVQHVNYDPIESVLIISDISQRGKHFVKISLDCCIQRFTGSSVSVGSLSKQLKQADNSTIAV